MFNHSDAETGISDRIQNRADFDAIMVHDRGRTGYVIDVRIVHAAKGGNDVANRCRAAVANHARNLEF